MDFLLSNPSPGADGASPSNFWMGTRFAFRNPFRVPLRTGAGLVPRIHMFWTRRAPWFFALKPLPRRRRSVALQLLDADAVCLSKPVPGSATNGLGVGPSYSHVLDSKGTMDFLLSNPSPGADGASPSNFWMGARSAFRNPFRVPLRTGSGSVPRIHMFWTRRAPWFFALKPFPRRRRSVALQLLDGDAVCLSKPVPGSATNGIWDPEF